MKRSNPAGLFPMFLKLSHRLCLVVGAGRIAESKIASLIDGGAKVRVVAPEATPKVRSWARKRRIQWRKRGFQPEDLDGAFLVVAAASSPKLHKKVFREARRRNVLCNVVDVPPLCDFYYPAVVRRGGLQIAISTAGRSPALAQRLRKELESQFGPEYEAWLRHLGKSREKLHSKVANTEQRRLLLHQQVSAEAFEVFRRR